MSEETSSHPNLHGPKARLVQKYFQVQVETASPDEILLLLLDGAVRFAESAVEAIDKKDLEKKNASLLKAQGIVMELSNSLQPEIGEEVFRNLKGLYFFTYQKLVEGNLRDDKDIVGAGLKVLHTLREAWRQAVAAYRQEQAALKNAPEEKAVEGQGICVSG
ncbi:MAG: flagellar export chaperone FliS [Planctomycetes bacterium]|nr:flagellar export chaperone FliS [Planctomycetota bacterium]